MSSCRSCDAPILWAVTSAGKAMPLNADPDPDGNVEVVIDRNGQASVVAVHKAPPMFAGDLYMPHHATCPNADEWRKR